MTHKIVYRQKDRKAVIRKVSKADKRKILIDAYFVGTEEECKNNLDKINKFLNEPIQD